MKDRNGKTLREGDVCVVYGLEESDRHDSDIVVYLHDSIYEDVGYFREEEAKFKILCFCDLEVERIGNVR